MLKRYDCFTLDLVLIYYAFHVRPADIPEILWFEEENELIRSCGVLSSALGLRKSFSTSDVSQLPSPDAAGAGGLRTAVSALALDTAQRNTLLLEHARLDHASRSCSTWVAVGEPVASTSQLPSPHGGTAQEQQPQQQQQQSQSQQLQSQQQSSSNAQSVPQLPPQPPVPPPPPVPFTGADLVRSVNKKVRQNYIRRRLVVDEESIPFPQRFKIHELFFIQLFGTKETERLYLSSVHDNLTNFNSFI